MFYGFILIDLYETMDIATKLRTFAKDKELIITYEKLKMDFYNAHEYSAKALFRNPEYKDISEYLKQFNKNKE